MREIHDHFFHQAKSQGFLARSAFKLIQINDRRKFFRPGQWVLDCGAAPGSWMQVAAQLVTAPSRPESTSPLPDAATTRTDRAGGVVVGFDLKPIPHNFNNPAVRALAADIYSLNPFDLLNLAHQLARTGQSPSQSPRRFDVILSDMAPNTSGDHSSDHHLSVRLCRAVLSLAASLLAPGGALVMKVFEGEAYIDLLRDTAQLFRDCKGFKPQASRSESREIYITAFGFNPSAAAVAPPARDPSLPPPRTKPAPGWKSST